MKNLNRLILTTLLVFAIGNVNAQDENNPWQITIGVNAVDVFPVGEDAPQGDYFQEFYNVEDQLEYSSFSLCNFITKIIVEMVSLVGISASINRLDKWGQTEDGTAVSVNNLMYYAVDGNVKYSLSGLLNTKKLEPFVGVGGGYTWIEEGTLQPNIYFCRFWCFRLELEL